MRAADVLARRLAEAGVRLAFGIPGGEILTLVDALAGAGIDFVTARHETAAGLMAEGAHVHGGAPALLVVTVGPGVSNAVNAVAHAYLDRTPMLVLSGCVDPEQRAHFTHQVFDQGALLRPVTKATFVAKPGTVDETIRKALQLAMAHPRGPVHIDLPSGLAPVEEPFDREAGREPTLTAKNSRNEVSTLVAWLREAKRPILFAGLECADSQVAQALRRFVDLSRVPVFTTYKAKGVLDEQSPNVLSAVALSPRADAVALATLQASDLVILVGYDPVEMRAAYAQPFAPQTRVVEIAPHERTHGMHSAQLSLIGDVRDTLLRAACQLAEQPSRTVADMEAVAARRKLEELYAVRANFGPEAVCHAISRTVPADVTVTVDTGAHRILLSQVFRARRPRQLLQSNGLCTMGYALPAAIGLALASGQPTLAVMGDGGFDMVAGELATLRDLDAPVTLLIFDDCSLALIDEKQRAQGLSRHGVWLGATDHVAVARAYGGHGERISDVLHLEHALAAALQRRRGFSVLSCQLARGAYEGAL